METLMVLPRDAEQKQTIEAILKALKIKYVRQKLTLEELEARLLPKQREVWFGLKTAIQEVKSGTAVGTSLEDFLNELEHENSKQTKALIIN